MKTAEKAWKLIFSLPIAPEAGLCRGCTARHVSHEDLKRRSFTHGRRYERPELWKNYTYFTKRIVPSLEAAGVRLALHPNNPPADELGGVACLINSMGAYKTAYEIAPSPAMEFCAGCMPLPGQSRPSKS